MWLSKTKGKKIKEPESKCRATSCNPASPSSWQIRGWNIPHPMIPSAFVTFTTWNWVMEVLHKINTFFRLSNLWWLPSCFHPHSRVADGSLFSCCRSVALGLSCAVSHHSDSRVGETGTFLKTHSDLAVPPHVLTWILTLYFVHQEGSKGRSLCWSKVRKTNLRHILREETLKSMPPGLGSFLTKLKLLFLL